MNSVCAFKRNRTWCKLSALLLLLFLSFSSQPLFDTNAFAAQATLAWDRSPDSTVTGYKVYYGTQSRQYSASINAGNQTTLTISNLQDGTTYYFAATAYNSTGQESSYSNEVSNSSGNNACTYSISPTSQGFSSTSGTSTVAVTTQTGCRWTATSGASWLTITAGSSGTGSGKVNYSVAANTGASRTAASTIAGKTFTVTQQGATTNTCTYTLSTNTQGFLATGGPASVGVTTQTGCRWTATSGASWITITSGSSGTGSGRVSYSVAANSGAGRTGTCTIAGKTFTVTQQGASATNTSCTYTLSNPSQGFLATGGPSSVGVTTQTGCRWTATSGASWITITSGSSGTGSGRVSYSVAANSGAARTGTCTIAGKTFTVTQQGR